MAVMRRFYEEVGRRLRGARAEAGMTQHELATAVNLSRASIANIEAGRQPFPAHMLLVFARALDRSPDTLLPSTDLLDQEAALPEAAIEGLDEQSKNWVRKILAPEKVTG